LATKAKLLKSVPFWIGPLAFITFLILGWINPSSAPEFNIAGILSWMIIWWVSEAVSIPVTAMLPMVFFPMLNIAPLKETAFNYGHPIIFLFMGGFFIAIAIEKWNLHERMALHILRKTGSSEKGVLAGFMISTALLSMWISNTACTLMMLPIAQSILLFISRYHQHKSALPVTLMLALSISASIGGFMTLIGTPPNIVMSGMMKGMGHKSPDFAEWMIIAIPAGVIILWMTYQLLSKVLYKLQSVRVPEIEENIKERIKLSGKLDKNEKKVIIVFTCTALLWILKDAINWILKAEILDDTIIALLGGLTMFVLPSTQKDENILEWRDVQKMPWNILLLFGGGLNVAAALEKSGVFSQMSDFVQNMNPGSILLLVGFVAFLVVFASELMSNVALAAIIIPVIGGIAVYMKMEPALLVVPVTLAASCGFMLPIATPPNAIVYSSGHIKMKEMIRTGFWINLISIIVITLVSHFLVPLVL
jgi:sodium-dependent dicarboxylate transporter 2/3/5